MPSPHWHVESLPEEAVRLFYIRHDKSSADVPIFIARLLIVRNDKSWMCKINGLLVPGSCSALSSIPDTLSIDDFSNLLTILFDYSVCPGNNDDHFVEFCLSRKGQFLSVKKDVVAFVDKAGHSVPTIRHRSCDILVKNGKRCAVCHRYRTHLRSMLASFKKCKKISGSTNYRFLNTPQQKQKRESLRKKSKILSIQKNRLMERLRSATEKDGVGLDSELEKDLLPVLESDVDSLPLSDFQRIFWKQQVCLYIIIHGFLLVHYKKAALMLLGGIPYS